MDITSTTPQDIKAIYIIYRSRKQDELRRFIHVPQNLDAQEFVLWLNARLAALRAEGQVPIGWHLA